MIKVDDIYAARERIRDRVLMTPSLESPAFSALCGADVWFKYETLQVTGSFKARGALNTLLCLSDEERKAGVVAASAGNHAQGLAWASSQVGCQAVIVMPETTPLLKINRTEELGGKVLLHGKSFDESIEKVYELIESEGLTLVHAYNDDRVVAGQGTIGLELLEQIPDLDAVLVPIGGGGQIAGIATAVKTLAPHVQVFGVQSEAAPAVRKSFAGGKLVDHQVERSLAEGIAIKRPGPIPYEIIERLVDDICLVAEHEIEAAIFDLAESGKVVVEGAGAAGVAALLSGRFPQLKGRRVAVILCGANIDPHVLSIVLERSLVRDSRLVRLKIRVPDRPGDLAAMLGVIGQNNGSVVRIRQNRIFAESTFWEVEVGLTIEVRSQAHAERILEALKKAGYTKVRRRRVQRSEAPPMR